MKIVYCAFGRAGKECLLQLFNAVPPLSTDNLMIFTHRKNNDSFLEFLRLNHIPYTTSNINQHIEKVADFCPTIIISAYYKYILKNDLLQLVNGKAMNLHPSLLPDYRGTFSSVWAILNGETTTGVTFHQMTSETDGGDIFLQKQLSIHETDTAYRLYHRLISLFVVHFKEAFENLLNDKKTPQVGKSRRYYNRRLPFDGKIVAKEHSIDFVQRFIRAMYFPPFPPAKLDVGCDHVIELENATELQKYSAQFKPMD